VVLSNGDADDTLLCAERCEANDDLKYDRNAWTAITLGFASPLRILV